MPYPEYNVHTALQVEAEVRRAGATPATACRLPSTGGSEAGLSGAEIEQLGQSGRSVTKVSRRDIPFVVASGATGATTVAATMVVAAMAGIRVFATGGIGGVHRGASESFDVSADLQELAHTPWPWCVRGEIHFGFGADPGVPGDPRRAGDWLPDQHLARVLLPRKAASRWTT